MHTHLQLQQQIIADRHSELERLARETHLRREARRQRKRR
jgi:hypothetical protein